MSTPPASTHPRISPWSVHPDLDVTAGAEEARLVAKMPATLWVSYPYERKCSDETALIGELTEPIPVS